MGPGTKKTPATRPVGGLRRSILFSALKGGSMRFNSMRGDRPDSRAGVQERSEPTRDSPDRPPREEFAYKEVSTPRRAERRPARDDLPPRRIRATVPAQTK